MVRTSGPLIRDELFLEPRISAPCRGRNDRYEHDRYEHHRLEYQARNSVLVAGIFVRGELPEYFVNRTLFVSYKQQRSSVGAQAREGGIRNRKSALDRHYLWA
jgi:hypothetical protein